MRQATLAAAIAALTLIGCGPEAGEQRSPVGGYYIYVTNEVSGDVSVIDPVSRKTTAVIALGKRPRGMALSPDGSLLYVALSGSPIAGPSVDDAMLPPPDKAADGIAIVDVHSRRLLRVLRGVSDPEQVAVSPDGARLYVASEDTGRLIVLDAASGRALASLDVGGEPEGVAVSRHGDLVLATSEADNVLTIVAARAQPRIVARVGVGMRPRHAAFSVDGARIFVPGELDASLTTVDTRTRQVTKTMRFPDRKARPMEVAVSANSAYVYVTTGRGGALARIDAKTLRYIDEVAVGARPWGLALSPDGRFAFTANGPSNDVAMVDLVTMTIVRKIPVGTKPWGALTAPSRR